MNSPLYTLSLFTLALSVSGCKKDFKCSQLQKGEWAVQFFDNLGEDEECPYEGHAVMDGEVFELVCEVSGKECHCSAGDAFGVYEVTVTNTETDETDFSVVEVEAAPEPSCVERRRIYDDEPTGLGGNGGAGGGEN